MESIRGMGELARWKAAPAESRGADFLSWEIQDLGGEQADRGKSRSPVGVPLNFRICRTTRFYFLATRVVRVYSALD